MGNNPIRYVDPDGRFLINTSSAEKVILNNKAFFSSWKAYMQPMVIATNGTVWNIELLQNKSISLPEALDHAIDRVKDERIHPSVISKTLLIANCEKLDSDIYKINIVAAVITETMDGTVISSNESETVAYATAAEVGITKFNKAPDKNRINEIANIVLSYTGKGVVVDEM